jgi:sensor histidine kinase YesM
VEREAALAELRALQAQIEPHFLFNTLANVASLIDSDPALSKRMLERFIRFLRASLAATRGEATTLAAEGELIAAYLDVIQVRMDSRLRYDIAIDPALASFRIPPMLLQPVVENAIRHGIEPRVEGGEVRVAAAREGESVRIEVSDTGVGFGASTRGGTGLTNLRERVKLLYAERGGVEISERTGGGTIVSLTIPA